MNYLIIKKNNLKLIKEIDTTKLSDCMLIKKYIDDEDLLTFYEQHINVCIPGFEYQQNGLYLRICATQEEAEAS